MLQAHSKMPAQVARRDRGSGDAGELGDVEVEAARLTPLDKLKGLKNCHRICMTLVIESDIVNSPRSNIESL